MSIRAATLAATALLIAAPALADAEQGRERTARAGAVPVKECTRHNSRFGYYANPWCSPAEQAAWDRWEARRRTR